MINYITKSEMIEKFGKNYFGITEFFFDKRIKPKIYIRNDISGDWLPEFLRKLIEISVLAHEEEHAKNGKEGSEWRSWIAGFKASPVGWVLGVIMSLTPSRLKMYPATTTWVILFIIIIFIYLGK